MWSLPESCNSLFPRNPSRSVYNTRVVPAGQDERSTCDRDRNAIRRLVRKKKTGKKTSLLVYNMEFIYEKLLSSNNIFVELQYLHFLRLRHTNQEDGLLSIDNVYIASSSNISISRFGRNKKSTASTKGTEELVRGAG